MAEPMLPDGFQLDTPPKSSASPPDGFVLDSASDMASAWRAKTGAAPDVPSPYDSGLPSHTPAQSFSQQLENASAAAGKTFTAGLEQTKGGAEMALAGIPTLVGMPQAADPLFRDIQKGQEHSQQLQAQAAALSKPGAVAGNVLSFAPLIFGGEALAPERAAEAATLIGRVGQGAARALPTASAIGTQQASTTAQNVLAHGGSTADAEKAYAAALAANTAANVVPAGVPGNVLLRAASGAALNAGAQSASQEAQHLVSPQYVQAPTWEDATTAGGFGALMAGAFGAKGAEPMAPVDPFLRNYAEGGAEKPAAAQAPAALPAPTADTPIQGATPKPIQEPEAPAVKSPMPAEAAFRKDPKTALSSLDHGALVQVAQDAGLDVTHNDAHAAIVNKLVATGPDYLHSDVLPEYLAAVTPAASAVKEPSIPSSAGTEPPGVAQPLGRVPAVPVDRFGTAYTPEQGMQSFRDAMDAATPNNRSLPPPVTTVDRAGTAMDSSAFSRMLDEQRQAQQRKLDLGLTPDIERAQVDRFGTAYTPEQGMQSFRDAMDAATPNNRSLPPPVTTVDRAGTAMDSSAFSRMLDEQRQAQQRKLDLGLTPDIERAQVDRFGTHPSEELTSQRDDFAPPDNVPWWAAGQYEDAAHQAALAALKKEVPDAPSPLSPRTPVDTSHDVTLGGGVAKDNSRIYIDKDIPQYLDVPKADGSGVARVNVWEDIAGHEAAEKPELDQGTHYFQAHEENANSYEDGFLRQKYGVTRAAVDQVLKPYLDEAAAKNPDKANIPADLDRKPYEDGGDTALLPEASNELAKIGIPEELHPQAMEFLRHAEAALQAGIPAEHLHDIARSDSDLPSKLTQIDQLIGETGHAHSINTESQGIPRQADTATLREAGEASQPASQQGHAEVGGSESAGEHEPTVSDRSDQLAQPDGSRSGGMPIAWRRPDWTPQVEGRAITEIDSLVHRYGGSTLADSIAQDLREHTTAQLIGQQISGPEDLAAIASVYRNPAFETMRYVYVDRAGNILGETAVSSRMPSSTKAFPTGTDDGTAWVKDNAPEGAMGVWLIHNHPSGNPAASQGDIRVTESLGLRLGDMSGAPKLKGHVILDHDTFGHIDAMGLDHGVKPLRGIEGGDVTRSPRGDMGMFDLRMTDPDFAAVTGKRIAAATPEDSSALVIMDAQRRVVSVHTFPNDFLASPRGAAMIGRLGGKRGAVGIGLVTDAASFAKHRSAFDKATARGLLRDAVVVATNGSPLNLAGTNLFPKELRKNFGQQSDATRERANAAVRAFEQQPSDGSPIVSLSAVRRALSERGLSDDQIKAMTQEQLRAEQATMRRRSEPMPEEKQSGETSSIKDASKAEQRAWKGKDEVEYNVKRSDGEAYAQAKERIANDPSYAARLSAELATANRPHSDVEAAVLNLDQARIKNDTAIAYEKLGEARSKGDEAATSSQLAQIKMLDAQMDANDLASRAGGSEAGRALRSRQVEINADYSIASLTKRARDAKGSDLSTAEQTRLHALAKEIDAREKAVAAREKALQDQRMEKRSPKERLAAKSKFDSLADKLKAIAQKDHMKPGCVV